MAKINDISNEEHPNAPPILNPGGHPVSRGESIQTTRGDSGGRQQEMGNPTQILQTLMTYVRRHEYTFEVMNDQLESMSWAQRLMFGDMSAALKEDGSDAKLIMEEYMSTDRWTTILNEVQTMVMERRHRVKDLSTSDPDLQRFASTIESWNEDQRRPPIVGICFPKTLLMDKLTSDSSVTMKRRELLMQSLQFTEEGIALIKSKMSEKSAP